MSDELMKIKKLYGESMAHLCRRLFPTLLETEGLLLSILEKSFAYNKSLASDIVENNLEEAFKNYIYSYIDVESDNEFVPLKKPEELLKEAGYILYECKTEEEIQSFKKYYKPDEELCTFDGGRLNWCYVFFAVKENVLQIRREDFPIPQRQDEYGTSVISIQFTKDHSRTLSIKNRYNHKVNNPDATFSNDLDNIIPGLTESFAREGYKQSHLSGGFEIPGYVKANDGKYYKYNYEINNICYCPNNIVIDNFEVKKFDKDYFIVFEQFILDLKQKRVYLYDDKIRDSFPESIGNIKNIKVLKNGDNKDIVITPDFGEDVIITIDKEGKLLGYRNINLERCNDYFLHYTKSLAMIEVPNLRECGYDFLSRASSLNEVNLPSLERCGGKFLSHASGLTEINLPSLERCGNGFLNANWGLTEVRLPSLKKCGDFFLSHASGLKKIELPKLEICGDGFLSRAISLTEIKLPKLEICGDSFLFDTQCLTKIELPKLEICGDSFLMKAEFLGEVELPNLERCGDFFLTYAERLTVIGLPKLEICGNRFLSRVGSLKKIELPKMKTCGNDFLSHASSLTEIELPSLETHGDEFLPNGSGVNKEYLSHSPSRKRKLCKDYIYHTIIAHIRKFSDRVFSDGEGRKR